MCKVNPKVDLAFKKLFGIEENKDLLISLVNSIVSEEDQVEDLELRNPYNLADYQAGKLSVLDIKAQDKKGRWYNIEMQISEDLNFDKRAIYYWAKLVTEQLSEGMMYKELKKTISINILDFNFVPDDEYHSIYKIINTATGKDDKLHDIFELHYIELRKFRKDFNELTTVLDRWITFLNKAGVLQKDKLPLKMSSDKHIKKALDVVNRIFDDEERIIYEVKWQALLNVEGVIASALEKGHRKGLEEGIEEGIKEGIEQGKREAKINLAKALLDVLDDKTIAEKTDLSLEVIQKIREER